MSRKKFLVGGAICFLSGILSTGICNATDLPSININLNNTTLKEINAGSKDTKYLNNIIDLTIDGAKTSFESVEIKGRGNSSWAQPKKPYQIKFDKKENLFDFGKSKKYILLANYLDESYLRNFIAFEMNSLLTDSFVPKSQFLNFYADGEYIGLYQLTTKNEIGSKRIDLNDDLGIVVEIDNYYGADDEYYFTSNGGDLIMRKENVCDEDPACTKQALSDFRNSYNKLEKAVQQQDWNTVTSLIDVDSFVNYFLISEFSANIDSYLTSFYFYKDGPNDKIHAGPIWDFDNSFGGERVATLASDRKSAKRSWAMAREIDKTGRRHSTLFQYLTSIPEFRQAVESAFQNKLSDKLDLILTKLDDQANLIKDDANRDGQKWGRKDFTKAVNALKDWIKQRFNYFDVIYGAPAYLENGLYDIPQLGGKYFVDRLSDGSYRFIQGSTGKVLDVQWANTDTKTPVHFYEWNGTTAQRWYVKTSDDGKYYLISKLTGLAMERNNANTYVNELTEASTQKFSIIQITNSIDENAHYEFVSVINDSFVMDISGASTATGTNTQLYSSNDTKAQSFYFRKNQDGTYAIFNTNSKKVLDVSGGSHDNSANIQQWDFNGTDAQKWLVYQHGDSSLTLFNYGSLKTIDISAAQIYDGSNIQQYESNGTAAQKWQLRLVENEERAKLLEKSQGLLEDGVYIIKSAKNPHFVLDVENGSTNSQANIQLYIRNNTNAQKWRVSHDAKGYVILTNIGSNKNIDVAWGVSQSGANVWQWENNGTVAQKWIVTQNSDGSMQIASAINSHRSLDVSGGQFFIGNNIQIWNSNHTPAQNWLFEKISD